MADNISDKIQSARTMEDIVNLLSILFTNLNNQNEMYYDMFLNPVPMDLNLERYDENGNLVTVSLPNVAKMRISSYSGEGNPNGKQTATMGALYIDTITRALYYKATGNDSFGWQLVWATANFIEGLDYLSPTGDGSQVQNLNVNNVGSGTLSVIYGGTGVKAISGIIKGNGYAPFEPAIVDEDYLAPSSFTGLIMHCPVADIPVGWLICDDTIYDITVRPELTRLCRKLGNKYGGDGITTFGVPNLINRYIKGGLPVDVGTVGEAKVGGHSHDVNGSTDVDGAHTHSRGTMNITADFGTDCRVGGAMYKPGGNRPGPTSGTDGNDSNVLFDASRTWTGETSSTPHSHNIHIEVEPNSEDINDVNHMIMVPIIKY